MAVRRPWASRLASENRVPSAKIITLVGTSENFARAPGGFLVLPSQGRIAAQIGLAVALHEREIQRPPRQPYHRHVDELLLEKNFSSGMRRFNVACSTKMSTQDW